MIEIIAAALGASVTVGAMGVGAMVNRSRQARDAVVRLTSAVENIAERLERLHVDIRSDRQETIGRLFDMEKRINKLELGVTNPSQSNH